MTEKKYLKDNKELMKTYNYNKNININLDTLTLGSNKKIWWICDKNHEWETSVSHRTRGQNCPYCSGHRVQKGYNDIFTTHSFLKKEWDYSKNQFDPTTISAGSDKMTYWKCSNGHSYKMRVSHRTSNHGCPYCAGVKTLSGFNDLETWCKENNSNLLNRWDYIKNAKNPSEYPRTSSEMVWWKCEICGFEYKNRIEYETININCPACNRRNQTSFPEQTLYFYIKKIFSDAISSYKNEEISEIDIFIPSKKIGIEYDGKRWHNSQKVIDREIKKYNLCKSSGIKLIRFREEILGNEHLIADETYKSSYNEDLKIFSNEIESFLHKFSKNIVVNIDLDRNKIYDLYMSNIRDKSLENNYPKISSEWDYDKNYPITPKMVYSTSNDKFYFKCPKGHSYLISIGNRTLKGSNCPYCSNKKILKGFNDLSTTNPEILDEWDYDKNILKPDEIVNGSNKKVWWKCNKCGKSYEHSPNEHIRMKKGCKYCNGGVSKKVNQYDLNGKYVATYDSCSIAGKILNVSPANISRACLNKKLCLGYQWRYLDDIFVINKDIEKYNKLFNNKEVSQYTKDGKLIATYESMTLAQQQTGIKSIWRVCNGQRKTAGGYIWKYTK